MLVLNFKTWKNLLLLPWMESNKAPGVNMLPWVKRLKGCQQHLIAFDPGVLVRNAKTQGCQFFFPTALAATHNVIIIVPLCMSHRHYRMYI